jgi:hypothetical protein
VAALAQNGDCLRADQAGAADDDNLHGLTPCRRPQTLNAFLDARAQCTAVRRQTPSRLS